MIKTLFFLLLTAGFLYSQSNFENNPVPFTTAEKRLESYSSLLGERNNSILKNVDLRSIGPSVMSGRVVDLDVNPDDPTIFYVAYASGGLWKTTNNGISFNPLFDNESVISIGDIAVDWKNNIIYVGTGENNSSRSSYSGTGIYKSTDDGKNWNNIGLIETHRIGRIVIDPSNPNTIWVAALGHLFSPNPERGIYKTNDGGKTWKQTLYINDNTGGIDLTVNPNDSKILYASMWFRERRSWEGYEAGSTSGIYKSQDGGESWQFISSKENGFPTGATVGRIGLALFQGNTNIIYALLDNHELKKKKEKKEEGVVTKELLKTISVEDFLKLKEDDLNKFLDDNNFPEKYTAKIIFEMVRSGKIKPVDLVDYIEDEEERFFGTDYKGAEVYRSDDAGKTWKKTNSDYINDMFYTYGYYFANIRVSPVNPDKIFIMGVPILRSDDGGKTFKSVLKDNVHADNHALWINPKREGHLILGNDGGINISYDDGNTWFKANTPAVGQFYSVNIDMDKPYNVYGGLQDNGVWYGPNNNKDNYYWYASGEYPFKSIMGGDGMQVAVDTRDNDVVYTGYQFGNYYRLKKSTKDYKYITPKNDLGEKKFRFNWQSPIQISVHNQDIIYLGSNRLHRSLNKGDKFETISPDITNGGRKGSVPYGTLTTIHESPLKFGLIYTGSDDGAVNVTKSGGYSWENISDGLPQNYWISRVQASAFDTATVYVALNGFRWDNFEPYIYRSTNYGNDWEQIGKNLPLAPVNVIKEDPENVNILYVGTDIGVFVSLDKGKSFSALYKGIPNVPVHDLVIHPRDKELVIGTHGRSIYIADVQYIQQLTEDVLKKDLYVFDLTDVDYSKRWGMKEDTWSDTTTPDYTFVYYTIKTGNLKVDIYTSDSLKISHLEFMSDRGLNFLKYDLSVDSDKEDLYLNDIKEKKEENKTDTGKLYLKAGTYIVEFELNGVTEKKILTIKDKPKKKRK